MYNKERKTKYAIRKLAVATVSLAIGTTVAVPAIVDSGQVAHAEEQGVVAKKYKVEYQINNANYREIRNIPAGLKALMPTDTKEYAKGETIRATAPTQTTYVDSENDGVWTFKSYAQEEKVANDLTAQGSKHDTIVFHAAWEFKANTEYEESYEFLSGTPDRELPYEISANYLPKILEKFGVGGEVRPQVPYNYIHKVEDGYWAFSGWDVKGEWRYGDSYSTNGVHLINDTQSIKRAEDLKFTGRWYFFRKEDIKGDISDPLYFQRNFFLKDKKGFEVPQDLQNRYSDKEMYRSADPDSHSLDSANAVQENPLGSWYLHYEAGHDAGNGPIAGVDPGESNVFWNLNRIYRWIFQPKAATYTFVSGTSGYTLPSAYATNLLPHGSFVNGERRGPGYKEDEYLNGDVIKPYQPGETKDHIPQKPKKYMYDGVNNGLWTFQGYDKDSGIVGKDVLNFIGTWTFTPTKNPTITKVDNPTQLTEEEKGKVEKAVKDANPTFPAETTVTVKDDGRVEIRYPDDHIGVIPATDTVAEKETSVKPTVDKVDTDDTKITGTGVAGSKIVVTLPNGDTKTTTVKPDGKWEVDLDNPLAKDGEVKVTQEETDKKVSPIAPTTVVPTTAEATTPNNPAVTKVDNPAQLTQDEKDKVVDEVKKANPSLPAGTTVTVDDNGDVTITYPDKSKDTIPGTSTVAEKETSAKPTVDKVDTDDLKVTGTGVAGSKIVVTLPNGDTKTTTVKPDGTWEVDLDNPLAKDGEVKVTQEETDKKVSPIAPTTVVPTTAEATTPNNPAVTKVDNPAQLTQDEKDKVVDEVKKANPGLPAGTTVTVDDNGDVTITYPDKSKDTIHWQKTV